MAERKGFEPLKQFPVYTLSKRAPSTTRPPLLLDKSIFPFINYFHIDYGVFYAQSSASFI